MTDHYVAKGGVAVALTHGRTLLGDEQRRVEK